MGLTPEHPSATALSTPQAATPTAISRCTTPHHSPIQPPSFTHSSTHPFTRSSIHSSLHHPSMHSPIHSPIYPFTSPSPIHLSLSSIHASNIHPYITHHPCIHSSSTPHLLIHLPIHPLTHPTLHHTSIRPFIHLFLHPSIIYPSILQPSCTHPFIPCIPPSIIHYPSIHPSHFGHSIGSKHHLHPWKCPSEFSYDSFPFYSLIKYLLGSLQGTWHHVCKPGHGPPLPPGSG